MTRDAEAGDKILLEVRSRGRHGIVQLSIQKVIGPDAEEWETGISISA